jgi:hypothetical protein
LCFVRIGFTAVAIYVQDLIHGAPIGQPAANRASVTAIYVDQETETETNFTRIIHGSSSDHKIDGKVRGDNFTQAFVLLPVIFVKKLCCRKSNLFVIPHMHAV